MLDKLDRQQIAARIKNGIIIIDKPPGLTSHEISALVRKITNAVRAGHAGTLDPEVSGVLPVALGKATKLLRYIAGKDKTYVGIIKFKVPQSKQEIEKLFQKFVGEITQIPPLISAVRKLPRKRRVHWIKVLEVKERFALFEANVDAGTYIRTLCEEVGGLCGGARMEELRRVAVGKIHESQAVTMYDLVDAMWAYDKKRDASMLAKIIRSPEIFIDLPKVIIKETSIHSILNGAQIMVPAIEKFYGEVVKGQNVAIYSNDKFVGTGTLQMSEEEIVNKKKGLVIKLERVHID